jgi:putative PEP-CTERM system TPR-repeat lipoprotein
VVAAAFGAQGQIESSEAMTDLALQLDPKNIPARLLRARLDAGSGKIEPALERVNDVLAEDPKRSDALYLKGELLWVGQNKPQEAARSFKEVLAQDPRHMPAHNALIGIALQQSDVAAFNILVEELKKALPNSPETRLYEAQSALIERDYPKAREITQQLLRIAPDNFRVLQLAGAVELSGGSAIVAESHLNKALQVQPRLTVARRLLAESHLRSGQAARALAVLQPLLEGNPGAEVLALAAEAHLLNGQFAQSEMLFTRAAKVKPDDPKVQTALALAQVAKGNVERGLADLEIIARTDASTYADLALISSQMRRQNFAQALRAIDSLQAKLPQSALPHQLRGRVLTHRKDIDGARSSFNKALEVDPGYFPAVASLATLDIAQKKTDDALKRFQEQLAVEPKNYRALLAVAELKLQTGAPADEVRSLLGDTVKANPADAAPRLLLIDFLLSRGEYAPARAAAQDAMAAMPANLPLLDALGRAQLAAGEIQQAISSFGRLAADQPDSAQAHQRLAQAHAKNNDYVAATRSLRRALKIDPRRIQAQTALVTVAVADKRYEEALRVAREVQEQRPRAVTGYFLEAEVHLARRDWAPAMNAMQAALERQKSTTTAIRLHSTMKVAGRSSDAERFASNWMRTNPKDSEFMFHLGSVAMDERAYAEAEVAYRKVLTLLPENAAALNNVAWLMTQQGKTGAVSYAEKAVKLLPDQPALMDTLAGALAAEGQLPQAIDWQRRALAKSSNTAQYRLPLAKFLLQSGNKSDARSELMTLASLGQAFPNHAEVTSLLEKL